MNESDLKLNDCYGVNAGNPRRWYFTMVYLGMVGKRHLFVRTHGVVAVLLTNRTVRARLALTTEKAEESSMITVTEWEVRLDFARQGRNAEKLVEVFVKLWKEGKIHGSGRNEQGHIVWRATPAGEGVR